MCIKNLEKCNKIMHVAKRNVILLYFSKLQIQYATNFYMNLFHIIDTYTITIRLNIKIILNIKVKYVIFKIQVVPVKNKRR